MIASLKTQFFRTGSKNVSLSVSVQMYNGHNSADYCLENMYLEYEWNNTRRLMCIMDTSAENRTTKFYFLPGKEWTLRYLRDSQMTGGKFWMQLEGIFSHQEFTIVSCKT